MSLAARTALYFQYTISARFRFSPAPSSAKEVSFLLRSFQSIAPVDYFRWQQTKFSSHNPFTQTVDVVFNASEQASQLDPFLGTEQQLDATPAQLEQRQGEIMAYLRRICGIPRYSYIENDDTYSEGKSMVPFRHKLLPQGSHLMGGYEISPSTIDSPFFLVQDGKLASEVTPFIRQNFQRLHKIDLVSLQAGLGKSGSGEEKRVYMNMNEVIDTAALMDLGEKMPMTYEEDERFMGLKKPKALREI
ncbi:hypothetical protein OXX80_006688 [Metschnikowia pulcherrima]